MYKVLLVDDEPVVIKNIHTVIPWEKYNVEDVFLCMNGLEALEAMDKEKPDIVITDLKMPGIDGIQLIQLIKENGHDPAFIILSGYGEFELAQSAMGQGVKSYLLKPCSEDDIIAALVNAISDVNLKRTNKSKAQMQQHTYNETNINEVIQQLEEAVRRQNPAGLLQTVSQLVDESDRNFIIFIFSQLLLKQLHMGILDTSQLTRFFNGIYETKDNDALATYMTDSLKGMVDSLQSEENFVDYIVQYIDDHLEDERLSLKWVARELVFRNEDYVSRSFSRQIGQPFNTYLTNKRLERAKFLISHLSEGKIYSVAEQIGFGHNPRYFSKLFKKHTGYTPKEYKNLKG